MKLVLGLSPPKTIFGPFTTKPRLLEMRTLAFFFVLIGFVAAKKFEVCELAEIFEEHFPPEQIDDWVCLARWESHYDTSALGQLNWDGSEDHGLFQINDRYWCGRGKADKGCNIDCNKLRDDDIEDDLECVKTIFDEFETIFDGGFQAWVAWLHKCQEESHHLEKIRKELAKCGEDKNKGEKNDNDDYSKRKVTNAHFIPYFIPMLNPATLVNVVPLPMIIMGPH